MLMEQLVSLPFRNGTTFLSNKVVNVHQALVKCEELGLKISAKVPKVLIFKASTVDSNFRIQGVSLAWIRSYLYLGMWLDQGLTFKAQVTYLRERTPARTNVVRVMMRTYA